MAEQKKTDVDWLVRRGISHPKILEAMSVVPRERFEGGGATPLSPEVAAKMIEALEVEPDASVLLVGTGAGYAAAVLSRMCQAVFTVERDMDLAKEAQQRLQSLGYKNVQVLYGANLKQYTKSAPYDAILVSAGMVKLPQRLAKRLKHGGHLVAPIGQGRTQHLVRMKRVDEDTFREESLGDLKVAPLLGDILVEMGVVERSDVEMAALEADVKGKRLGEALIEGQYVEEADIYNALAHQNDMRLVTSKEVLEGFMPEILREYPKAFLNHNRLIPVHNRDGMLHAVTTDPRNDASELAYAMGLHSIDLHLITPTDYGIAWAAIDRGEFGAKAKDDDEEKEEPTFDADTIAYFENIIREAIDSRASDIHFERFEDAIDVNFRIDGEIRPRTDFAVDKDLMQGILELVKVSGRLDRSDRRRPQTGHFQRRVDDRVFDIQARTVPTVYGEAISLRLLPQSARVMAIDELGFTTDTTAALKRDLERRSGIVLVVGPASSGRSTTLYAFLQQIAQGGGRKIVAVEHPVTFSLRGVHQYRIDRGAFRIYDAIETAITGDADVLHIGEIVTDEIARQAIRASRAGHLVFASVPGRVAVDGILRLLELGISPNAIAGEVVSVVAQRLAKRVCTECRERTEVDEKLVREVFGSDAPDDLIAFEGAGCEHCNDHGTHGRIPVTEYLPVDAAVRAAISQSATAEALHAASVNAGTTAMLDTGARFVKSGIIPQEELRWIPRWT